MDASIKYSLIRPHMCLQQMKMYKITKVLSEIPSATNVATRIRSNYFIIKNEKNDSHKVNIVTIPFLYNILTWN